MKTSPNVELLAYLCIILLLTLVQLNASEKFTKFKQHRKFENSFLRIPNDNFESIEFNVSDNYLRFITIGDWGGLPVFPYRTLVEENVALYMNQLSAQSKVHFNLALGDNFYFNGVTDSQDKRFNETFENVFLNPEIPWFVVLGNHDHLGNASSQIEYSKYSKRWIMPDYNYSVNVNLKDEENFLSFLMIDTVLLCSNSGYDWNVNANFGFRTRREKLRAKSYLKSIEDQLKKISAQNFTYIIVVGHYPVWSVGEHGPTKCLVDNLRPLLHKYNVSAYLAGHEHDMEHLTDVDLNNNTVEYIISGASNLPFNSTAHINDVPAGSLKFYWADDFQLSGALCLIEANMNNITITYLQTNGKSLYQTTIPNRNKKNTV